MWRRAVLCAAFWGLASAAYDNFPVKSWNINSADAVGIYELISSEDVVTDAHPVYGLEAADTGFFFCGKGLESESITVAEAFAVKLTSSGLQSWTWRSNNVGKDAANACVQLSNSEYLVVGYRTTSSVSYRSITKLSSTGTEIWTATNFLTNRVLRLQAFSCAK